MQLKICGVPYTIVKCEDHFDFDKHFGQTDFLRGIIKINANCSPEIQDETLCHEIVHAMLVHTGYIEYSQNERFVQALGNAIYQTFCLKEN